MAYRRLECVSLLSCGLLVLACSAESETGAQGGAAGSAESPRGGAGGSSGAIGNSGGSTGNVGGSAGASAAGGASGSSGSAGTGGLGGGGPTYDTAFCSAALDAAVEQYSGFKATYTNPKSIPRSAKNGTVNRVATGDWTSGFPAGSFWYLYEHTQKAEWRTVAEQWTAALEPEKTTTTHHDLGFQFMNTFGNGYRLTKNADYPAVLVTAATSLSTRYKTATGLIRSWDSGSWGYPVIIDNMMNLELLYFASKSTSDTKFANVATSHADKTLLNHFRNDGSSFHLVDYDPKTGAVVKKQTVQGLADSSSWARGQAWGIYGYTAAYRETKDARYLAQAQKSADYLSSHPDLPSDKVPYFDFDAPKRADVPDHRDTSAGAVFASALFELAGYVDPASGKRHMEFALELLKSLSSSAYAAAKGTNSHFLLMHSVGHYPANSEIDVAINYADYYYLEALMRCTRVK